MARRPGPVKKKSPKPTKSVSAAKLAKVKQPLRAANAALYVIGAANGVALSDSKPKAGAARGPLNNLPDAKSAVMDALIESIDSAERLLLAVRRAESLDALRQALRSGNSTK